jgi:hypothetical protein
VTTTILVVAVGAFLGGFVSGLTGFGTALIALAFWLYVVDPAVSAVLVAACAVVGQTQSIFVLRHAIKWHRSWPFLVGGIIGVPVGVASLHFIVPNTIKILLGIMLVGYSVVMFGIRRLPPISRGGKWADGLVGFGGGALGGMAGLAGPLPTIWCGLRGWEVDAQRAVYQPFNLVILALALGTYICQGVISHEVWGLVFMCVPATIAGTFLGVRTYGRVNEQQFKTLVHWLLLVSGLVLTVSNFTAP